MKTIELPAQHRIAATSALILLSASAGAAALDGSEGINLYEIGRISNAPHITYGSVFSLGWDNPLMQGFVVPAAQLTGLTVDNTAVDPLDLLPVQLQSAAIIDSSGFAVVAMTAGATPGAPGAISFRNSATGALDGSLSADSMGNLTVSGSPLLTTANSPGLLSGEFVIRPSSNQGSLDSLLLEGTYNGSATNIPKEGVGTRMMWYPEKCAFRAGHAGGVEWNDENIGTCSVAFGSGSIAKGQFSSAFGAASKALGNHSFASGWYSDAIGFTSFTSGAYTKANGDYSSASGYRSQANGKYSSAMGFYTTAASHSQFSIGNGNRARASGANPTQWVGDSNNAVFDVGVGNVFFRKSGLAVMQDGSVEIGLTTDAAPTPPLRIKADGNAYFSGQVILCEPQGDISMGDYQ